MISLSVSGQILASILQDKKTHRRSSQKRSAVNIDEEIGRISLRKKNKNNYT